MPFQTVRAVLPIRHSGVLRVPGQASGDNAQDFVVDDAVATKLIAAGFVTAVGVGSAPEEVVPLGQIFAVKVDGVITGLRDEKGNALPLGSGAGLSAPVAKGSLAATVQASLGKADTAMQPSSVADGTALGANRTLAASDSGACFTSDVAGAVTVPESLPARYWIYTTGAGAVTFSGGAITAGGTVTVTDRRVVNASATPCALMQRLGANSFEVRGFKAA